VSPSALVSQHVLACTACGGVGYVDHGKIGRLAEMDALLSADPCIAAIRFCVNCQRRTPWEWRPVTSITALPGTGPRS